MAIVRPPRVIVSIVRPKAETTRTPVTSDKGIARAEISVVRTLPRKRSRMTTTRMAPSRRASITLPIATSMKSACRKFSVSMTTPSGRVSCRRPSASSISSVSSRVLAPGCFWTERMAAGSFL